MAKQKKKRNKTYAGSDAANARPVVTRISAVNRSKTGQWWYDRRRFVKPVAIAVGILLLIIIVIIGIVSLLVGR